MLNARDLARFVQSAPPGQRFTIARSELRDLPPFEYNGERWTAAEQIMENIIGSSYEYRFWDDERGNVVFERLSEPLSDGRRTYVSPDQRRGFVRDALGYYLPKGDA